MSRLLFINPPVLAADPVQIDMYAEALPFGLLQIATHYRESGHELRFIDMMGYMDRDFSAALVSERRWGRKPVGDKSVGRLKDVFLYGMSVEDLDALLEGEDAPDEVLVTCCIPFNYEPAHAVIRLCRERFPKARIRFGGFYPSAMPDHARGSGAHEIFEGRFKEAEGRFPRLDIMPRVPPIWLFRLVHGCRYRCSFCMNPVREVEAAADPVAVADEIVHIHERYGVNAFSNWDPNVMLKTDVLEVFLDAMIDRGTPVDLKFEMGVQPDRLDEGLAEKMRQAGTVSMTIPFESAEPKMARRFGKPYRVEDPIRAVRMCRDLGFSTRSFHCTWVIGVRGEGWRHIFGTWLSVLESGGLPTPFPLTLTPGTREYELHLDQVAGKDLSDLNGHLWPTLPSYEAAKVYDLVLEIVSQPDIEKGRALAQKLPAKALKAFEREVDMQ